MRGTDQTKLRLTARGAITLLLVVTLLGQIVKPGPAFVVGCVAAVLLVQPRDLLPLVVTPPLVFFATAVFVEFVRSLKAASMLQALGLGLFTSLSSAAPWLFGGSAVVLGIAWWRGLPQNMRDLRENLATRAEVPRPRRGDTTFDPEPEGYFEPRVYGEARD
ncbi:hypothetical protein IMZ11_01605 [Microtetraspora sp. AC03309]|uniref:DUF6542 domain-containing protein n=1 Tax=Microtetraspora sp. AC03309 TaxID=2779376 RepID=UPI001E5B6647|nr:DUF6542 domain-containing protein [Microtetraspora sp. AC03309]MCC5574336.1 hypothetical protein [Microtetraspora sp. AC03309]